MIFDVLTPGPCPWVRAKTIDDAADWVEKRFVLKRGWTISRETIARESTARGAETVVSIHVHNSRGRLVSGALVRPAIRRGGPGRRVITV